MKNPFNAEFGGDSSYYWDSVSETLTWDAYSRYEVLADDYSDVEHLLAMREPVRVAVAPDAYSAPKSYTCDRCGIIRSKRSDHDLAALFCSDCSFVERHADPPPVETVEQRRLRVCPPSPAEAEREKRLAIEARVAGYLERAKRENDERNRAAAEMQQKQREAKRRYVRETQRIIAEREARRTQELEVERERARIAEERASEVAARKGRKEDERLVRQRKREQAKAHRDQIIAEAIARADRLAEECAARPPQISPAPFEADWIVANTNY